MVVWVVEGVMVVGVVEGVMVVGVVEGVMVVGVVEGVMVVMGGSSEDNGEDHGGNGCGGNGVMVVVGGVGYRKSY